MLSVGIDIGSFSVKLAELRASAKGFAFSRFQEFPLSTDPTKDKKIEILDILRKISAAYDPEQTRFIMAIRQEHSSLRLKTFPFKERHKIIRSIAFELEDDIPFSQDDAIFDAKICRYLGNAAQVLATAVPKEHIKELLQLAHDSEIEPHLLTVEGLALGNHLEKWGEPPLSEPSLPETPEAKPAQMILDIGHNRTILSLSADGGLLLSRNIDFGGKNIVDAIAQKYGIHYVEALKELQKKSFILLSQEEANRDQIVFSDVIKKALEPLIQTVRLTLLEALTQQNIRISQVLISGGTSQIKNLGPFLTQAWEVPVNRLHHLSLLANVEVEATAHLEAVSAIAVGIAIEGLKRPRNPAINLLKGEFAPRQETLKIFWTKWAYTAQVLAAGFITLLIYGVLRDNFAADMATRAYDTLKQQAGDLADLKGRQATPSAIKKFVKAKKEEINNRKLALKVNEINSALDVITRLHQSAPGPKRMVVEIRKLSVENDLLEVQGEYSTKASLDQFREVLQSLSVDGKVNPSSPLIQPSVGKQVFAFRLRVDRRRGGG